MSKLLALFGLRPGDAPSTGPALGFALLGAGAMSLASIACDALFVTAFDLEEISRFYVVTAAVRLGAAAAYAALARTAEARGWTRLDGALLVATSVSMAVSGVLARGASGPVLYAVCVALLVLPPLLPLMTFKAVASVLAPRQARRLLPLVAAAATIGIVAAGAAVPLLAAGLGTPGLLLAGGLLAALAAPLPGALAARSAPPDAAAADEGEPRPASGEERASAPGGVGLLAALADAGRDLRDAPVAAVVLAVTLLGAAAASFVDYGFKASLKARYGGDEMAVILGAFGAASNLVVLVVQLFGTSRFVGRFGVRSALATPFAALVALGACLAAAPGVAVAAAAKLAQTTFHYALASPVGDLLLTPAPPTTRMRAKVLAKGLASPIGALMAGLALASFGEGGPPFWALGAILAATGVQGIAATARARRAYTQALALALGEGQLDVGASPAAVASLRTAILGLLAARVARGDVAAAERALALFGGRFFGLDDLAPALRADLPEIRRAAVAAALRVARREPDPRGSRPDEAPDPAEAGRRLLALAPPDDDDETERQILAAARALGATADRARLDRALARTRTESAAAPPAAPPPRASAAGRSVPPPRASAAGRSVPPPRASAAGRSVAPPAPPVDPRRAAADLWAEALVGLAQSDRDAATKELRREALAMGSPRRPAALRALGDLCERRAQKEVLLSLGSADRVVFAEAARTAVLIEAYGAVAALLERLTTGSEVRAVTRALALAGPAVIDDLIAALPTTRGQGAAVATSIASGRSVTGTVRAARVLARLGPEACARVLARFGDLGYRARNAVARALAAISRRTREALDPELVLQAMEIQLAYAESLGLVYPRAPGYLRGFGSGQAGPSPQTPGLLRRELRARVQETAARLLDLASVLGDRSLIMRARASLVERGDEHARSHALELLENVLPRPLAARAVALLEMDWEGAPPATGRRGGAPLGLDGWLEKCRAFDADELASTHPMVTVLEKVLVLVDSSLFTGLSGEELYPVAEIAEPVEVAAGEVVVRQGDPGDALFVIAGGRFEVVRDEAKVRDLGPGAAFGEMALLDGAPRAATVRAAEAGSVLRIPRAEFEALLDESPELARGVIRTLLGHLRGTSAASTA